MKKIEIEVPDYEVQVAVVGLTAKQIAGVQAHAVSQARDMLAKRIMDGISKEIVKGLEKEVTLELHKVLPPEKMKETITKALVEKLSPMVEKGIGAALDNLRDYYY